MPHRFVLLLLLLGFAAGCASGNCYQHRKATNKTAFINPKDGDRDVKKVDLEKKRTFVFKYDGTKQCGMGKKVSLSKMAKQLEGIQVYSSKEKTDGLMRIQVCGAPTGHANVFEISVKDLAEAQKRGFNPWRFD